MIDNKVNMFVAKKCNRTDAAVQVWDPLAATKPYLGAGEMIVTDTTGKILTTASDPSKDTAIQIYQRSADGNKIYKSEPFKAKDITSYRFNGYCAYTAQEWLITTPPVYNSFSYILRIRRVGTHSEDQFPRWKSVVYKSAASGNTAATIVAGLAAAITASFANDIVFPVTAIATGSGNAVLRITAGTPSKYTPGLFGWSPFHFDVETIGWTPTSARNTLNWSGTDTGVTISTKAYDGQGTYPVTADMEWDTKLNLYHPKARGFNQPFPVADISLDSVKYESNGTDAMRYDYVTINLTNVDGVLSRDIVHNHSIVLALPVEGNTTTQVGCATNGVITVLNDIIYTNWGIGSSITLTTP